MMEVAQRLAVLLIARSAAVCESDDVMHLRRDLCAAVIARTHHVATKKPRSEMIVASAVASCVARELLACFVGVSILMVGAELPVEREHSAAVW